MSGWRQVILEKFNYESSSILLVHDPDLLLNDEQLLQELEEMGYDVFRYEDSVTFRYFYEKEYRLKDSPFKLLVYSNEDIVFPYEYVRKAMEVRINVQTIFPNLSASIIRQLSTEDFDTLFTIYSQYRGTSSDEQTIEFIIKYLYKIPYEIITSEVDLYKTLLSIHYKKNELPEVVIKYLLNRWRTLDLFTNLPMEKLLSSSTFFYNYIEDKWEDFVRKVAEITPDQVNDSINPYISNPLADSDVRRLMNDLFLEGILSKVKGINTKDVPSWMKVGIETGKSYENVDKKLAYLQEKIKDTISSIQNYKDWIAILKNVAEFKATILVNDVSQNDYHLNKFMDEINNKFYDWMMKQYHTLISLPPYPNPKLVHHIPHVINNEKGKNEKIALLVLDGMSFIQWRSIQNYLKDQGFFFDENGVFAWVPTLTSVSRQAIFSGNMPISYSSTIHRTSAEERLWKAFWENQGIQKQYVAFQKSLGRESYDRNHIKGLSNSLTRVYGAVIDVIDQFSHHAVLGEKSIVSELNVWLQSNYLAQLLNDLLEANFSIYITSDHGNTIASGVGRFSEGVLVEQRGERVRIYNDETLYEDSASKLPALKWSNIGLPENYFTLLSLYKEAFVPKGHEVVTHGGISMEEVIVPFVKVQKNGGSVDID